MSQLHGPSYTPYTLSQLHADYLGIYEIGIYEIVGCAELAKRIFLE